MKDQDQEQFKNFLKQNMPPVSTDMQRDLWPKMLQRLDEGSAAVHWLDWALAGLLALMLIAVPEVIPLFLYQF